MDADSMDLVLANRSFLWNMVARGFAEEPDAAFLGILASKHAEQEVLLLDDACSNELLSSFSALREFLVGDDAVEHLRAEYVRMFVGPGDLPVPVWENVMRRGGKALFSGSVLQVREAYRAAGFLPARYPNVADDFIGIECDFMAKLANRACEGARLGKSNEALEAIGQSLAFVQSHLSAWIPLLAGFVRQVYGMCFYAALCDCANCLVRRDESLLKEIEFELS